MSRPNYEVRNAIDQKVPIWNRVHSMSCRDVKFVKDNLRENGFAELQLEKDRDGIYVLPWWMKPCVFSRQYMRANEGPRRSLTVFQVFESVGQM